jgi:hypothetical protein
MVMSVGFDNLKIFCAISVSRPPLLTEVAINQGVQKGHKKNILTKRLADVHVTFEEQFTDTMENVLQAVIKQYRLGAVILFVLSKNLLPIYFPLTIFMGCRSGAVVRSMFEISISAGHLRGCGFDSRSISFLM